MLFSSLPHIVEAKPQILCKTADKKATVIISPAELTEFGRKLNCISGNFIYDMTPCAPTGGYGLSMPTGAVPLTRVVDNAKDYQDHIGGVVSSFVSDSNIYFAGGFHFPEDGYKAVWEFSANRLTGDAELKLATGKTTKYFCTKVEQKF